MEIRDAGFQQTNWFLLVFMFVICFFVFDQPSAVIHQSGSGYSFVSFETKNSYNSVNHNCRLDQRTVGCQK